MKTICVFSQKYNAQIYDYKNGIDASGIVSLEFENKTNKMWLSTRSDGIYSYNGKNFINFKPKQDENPMHSSHVLKDIHQRLWYVNYTNNFLFYCKIEELPKFKIDTLINFNLDAFKAQKIEILNVNNHNSIVLVNDSSILILDLENKESKILKFHFKINNFLISDNRYLISANDGVYELDIKLTKTNKIFSSVSEGFISDKYHRCYYNYNKGVLTKLDLNFDKINEVKLTDKITNSLIDFNLIKNNLYIRKYQ